MKFTTSIKPLSEAVSNAVLALPPKATDLRFESITMTLEKKSLSLFATDGDTSFTTTIAVESGDKGSVALNAKRFQDILRNMYDAVAEFKTEKKDSEGEVSFSIKTDRGSYKIAGSLAKGEKEEKLGAFDVEFAIEGSELKRIAETTLFAASTDSMRPAMMGILLEIHPKELRAVSTDGHRLVRVIKDLDTKTKEKLKVIVPARVLSIVQRALQNDEEVKIAINVKDAKIQFVFGETKVVSGLIAENYPNYEAVIPLENDKKMIINRSNMLGAVKRVARFSSRGDVRLQIEKKEIRVSAENADEGSSAEETLPCEFNADGLLIGFNAKFIDDALSHIDSEEVEFEFSTPTRAAILRRHSDEKKDNLLMLVMPVRINV
ncbi:MAG: DNA polymerase III subunit beta [Chloroherpetonaceae bacterium]|nr:DNA polymerase III subunit beta [Chloroherpetonaceae bacterium]MDW8438373.1 DNA polymerase III subunit beta [Chloroherpetonaceae bacterium]